MDGSAGFLPELLEAVNDLLLHVLLKLGVALDQVLARVQVPDQVWVQRLVTGTVIVR